MKLSTGKEIKLKEMSVDDIDYCNDLPQMKYEGSEVVAITNLAKQELLGFVKVLRRQMINLLKAYQRQIKTNYL